MLVTAQAIQQCPNLLFSTQYIQDYLSKNKNCIQDLSLLRYHNQITDINFKTENKI